MKLVMMILIVFSKKSMGVNKMYKLAVDDTVFTWADEVNGALLTIKEYEYEEILGKAG